MRRIAPVVWLFLPASNTEFLMGKGTGPFLTSPAEAMTWLVSIFR